MDNPLKGLSSNQQKVLIGAGVVAAGYVVWRWSQNSGGEEITPTTDGMDADLAGTGIIGSNVGGSENVGNSSNQPDDLVDTNNEWFSEAVERLANGGWNEQAVQSALGDFLTGQSLTVEEAKVVRAAVGAMGGYPPNGPRTIKEIPGETDASKLIPPTGLKASNVTSSSVTISWNPVAGAKRYRLYRTGAFYNIGEATGTAKRVDGLQPGTTYTFYVAAGIDGEKFSARSAGIKVKTPVATLKKPTGLRVWDIGRTSAKMSWTSQYPGEYIYRRSGSSHTWESVDNSTTLSGLKPRTKYSFQVAAVQVGSRKPGPWSSYVTFTTKR